MQLNRIVVAAMLLICLPGAALAGPADEWQVKREQVFEFAQPPAVRPVGDGYEIRFASKAACDVTVAIEKPNGQVIRHLACGVLGPNAPAPLKADSLAQTLLWDGKDDGGVIVENRAGLRVRVSLGLRPQFERTLFWQPRRRPGTPAPLMAATAEGVYVFQGGKSMDSLILYSHDGDYLRTVYPFPSEKIENVQGLQWQTYPQDGLKLPVKSNYLQSTMLTSGTNATGVPMLGPDGKPLRDSRGDAIDLIPFNTAHFGMFGTAATCMAISGNRIAIANRYLNRLATDGTSGGMKLLGPKVYLAGNDSNDIELGQGSPMSAAISPDGRTLYLTGYVFARIQRATQDIARLADCRAIPVVLKASMDSDEPPTVFVGSTNIDKAGSDNASLKVPTSVATDKAGRVYVGDYMNNRVQVFDADGKHLKSIAAERPAQVVIHPTNGEIYVFSWWVRNQYEDVQPRRQLVRYGPFDNPKKLQTWEYASQSQFSPYWGATSPIEFTATIDFFSPKPRIWIAEPWTGANVLNRNRIKHNSIDIMEIDGDKIQPLRSFAEDVTDDKIPVPTAIYYRQRLYVNPVNGRCYVSEGDDSATGKSFKTLFELNPDTGAVRPMEIPFDAEDMCFDINGLAYVRTIDVVVRYDPRTWREVPWDYGEERSRVAYGWMSGTKTTSAVSGLIMPSDGNWHHGGMFVSPRGHLLVACGLNITMSTRTADKYVHTGKKYEPRLYAGRLLTGRGGATCLHVWDKHGQMVHEDAVPGLADLYGVGLDNDDNCYFMSAAPRVIDGKPYLNPYAGTVMKFPPNKGRIFTEGKGVALPMSPDSIPKRDPDISGGMQGRSWAEGAAWFYGGVGFGGKNTNGCACHNARMTFDFFNRTFAPELDRYRVAVLDSAGNLILRMGRYGNVDEGKPLVADDDSALKPRSIGGDEIALFHGAYLAAHTDHRLFIADPGNGRVLSVKLNYHQQATVELSSAGK